ncbi:hypothetical protein BH11ACT8_BH11ACT8_35650 [soil metagenome]
MTAAWLSAADVRHLGAPEAPAPSGLTRWGMVNEWRVALQPARLATQRAALAGAPRGDGSVVLDVPGWKAHESTLAPLRGYLRRLGHDARGWGLGTNRGRPEADTERLLARVRELADGSGQPVALVGWSLGGVISREVARAAPEAVRRVVTFGTPAVGGPTYTVGATSFGEAESRRAAAVLTDLDATDPIRVPLTVIFSRRDRIVSWPACLDRTSADVTHVEVGSTHVAMGLDPDVWRTVAQALAGG